jgi:hypothetical protein
MLSKLIISGILGCTLLLAGCKTNESGGNFTVSGNIKNAENQKLLLQEVPYGGKAIITLDSITIDKEGNYEFKFIAKQEGIYRLATDKEFEIIFINDNENIKISALIIPAIA